MAARNDRTLGLVPSVKAGMDIGPVPTAPGDAEPDLVRVLGPIPEPRRIGRLLGTPALRRTPRVAAFFHFIVERIEGLQPMHTG